jgi:hypothetical protein
VSSSAEPSRRYSCTVLAERGAVTRVEPIVAADDHSAAEHCRMMLHEDRMSVAAELRTAAGGLVGTFMRTLDEAGEPVVEAKMHV